MLQNNQNSGTPPQYNFDPDEHISSTLFDGVGERADRPFMILATIADTSLGDMLSKVNFASTLKNRFDHARLIVRYRDVRPYSKDVIALGANIDHAVPLRDRFPSWLHSLFKDGRLWNPLSGAIKGSKRRPEAFFDLVLVDWMMNARTVHALGPSMPFRIPPDRSTALAAELAKCGAVPGAPIATIHYRTEDYPLKGKSPIRTGKRDSYGELINYIVDELGCQVVVLGHPEMQPFPARTGVVDLSRRSDAFMLQAFAVSQSRFMIGGPSGPMVLGWGFGVPTGAVDFTDWSPDFGSDLNVTLTHEVTTPDGNTLANRALADSGLLDSGVMREKIATDKGYSIRKNSGAELSAVARHLHSVTTEITGWRPEPAAVERVRPNTVTLPLVTTNEIAFLDV
jgi:putative glycosyltransferase (TIGR04372 family)